MVAPPNVHPETLEGWGLPQEAPGRCACNVGGFLEAPVQLPLGADAAVGDMQCCLLRAEPDALQEPRDGRCLLLCRQPVGRRPVRPWGCLNGCTASPCVPARRASAAASLFELTLLPTTFLIPSLHTPRVSSSTSVLSWACCVTPRMLCSVLKRRCSSICFPAWPLSAMRCNALLHQGASFCCRREQHVISPMSGCVNLRLEAGC